MEGAKQYQKNKGGRPKKEVKQNQFIGVKCSTQEKTIVRENAKEAGLTLSEFLRVSGLKKNPVKKSKVLPKEVLQFTGTLNHLAANLNQLAKKHNRFEELDDTEQAALQLLSEQIKELAITIKNYLR